MDKQKQMIEEMAKDMLDYGMEGYPTFDSVFTETKLREQVFNVFLGYAERLIKKGYRKIPEGTVVLTKEEYKRYERIEKIIKLAKREKALGYEVKNGKLYYFTNMLEGFEYEFKDLQEICDALNHYNEEFLGLDERLAFWQGKAEEIRKETAEKFAGMAKARLDERELKAGCSADILFAKECVDEICKEITEGKV